MTAARWPESQEQILEAAVASLTEAGIPPDEQDGWLDPDADLAMLHGHQAGFDL